jgi:hypothetical protein
MIGQIPPQLTPQNPYAKELFYFKVALEVGLGVWLARKAISGERMPKAYIWWGSVGAFGAAAWALYRAQKLEMAVDRILPVAEIERTVASFLPEGMTIDQVMV